MMIGHSAELYMKQLENLPLLIRTRTTYIVIKQIQSRDCDIVHR